MGLVLRPTGDNFLVEPDAAKEMSEGGNIHIPKEAQERRGSRSMSSEKPLLYSIQYSERQFASECSRSPQVCSVCLLRTTKLSLRTK